MRHINSFALFCCAISMLLASCSAPKKVPYLVEAELLSQQILTDSQATPDPVITVGDLLNKIGRAHV